MAKLWKPAAVLLVTFALAVSLKNDFVYFLLGFELMVSFAAFCQVFWLSRKVKVQVRIPESRVLRGESFQIRAELKNTSRFPIPQLMVRLAVRPFPEQEEVLLNGKLMLDGREQGSLCFQMDSSHCGCLEIRSDRLVITDCLGIFQYRCPIDRVSRSPLFILPEAPASGPVLPDFQGRFPGEKGDGGRQGSSAVDISGIRSYREGDSLKLVHWKLTARWNDLMVKEMQEPAEKITWVYLNLREQPGLPGVRRDPEAWDAFLETVLSLSAMLLKMGKRHLVCWADVSGGRLERCCVSDEASLRDMLCGLLRTDSFLPGEQPSILKELFSDETKGTYIEIDLQGNLIRTDAPG